MSDERNAKAAWATVLKEIGWDPVLPTGLNLGKMAVMCAGGNYLFTPDADNNGDGTFDVWVVCDGEEVDRRTVTPPTAH